jgi:excisionase family DNA binding protein
MNGFQTEIKAAVLEALKEFQPVALARERLLTVQEAAVYLKLSPRTIKEMIAVKDIPVVRGGVNGGRVMLDLHDLDTWIRDHKR